MTRVAAASITTVAALAPDDIDVVLCDEAIQKTDFDIDAVIGISANVTEARRGLEIAAAFRTRREVVAMGGPHVSLAPELLGHADSLAIGELEPVAGAFFADKRAGTLRPRYHGGKAGLTLSPQPRCGTPRGAFPARDS